MYGECAKNTDTDKNANCFYNDEAKPLPDEGLDLLLEVCPMLYNGMFSIDKISLGQLAASYTAY